MIKFLILILISTSLFSSTKIDREFILNFSNPAIKDRFCNKNTKWFLERISKKKMSETSKFAVHLEAPYHPWTFGQVPAFNSRFGREKFGMLYQTWRFHVFSVVNNKVYDFSFNKKPLILSFTEYIKKMFIPKSKLMINGPSFRTRGMGPYFTKNHALDELKDFEFTIFKVDSNGKYKLFLDKVDYQKAKRALQ